GLFNQWRLPPDGVDFEPNFLQEWEATLTYVLALRAFIRLGVQNGEVNVGPDGNVSITFGQHMLSVGPKKPDVSEGKGPGIVALYYIPPDFMDASPAPSLAMVVLRGDEVVRAWLPKAFRGETGSAVVDILRFGVLAEAHYSELERGLGGAVG